LEPAHRELEHDALDVHPGAGGCRDSAGRLLQAAVVELGRITAPNGKSATFGSLTQSAAVAKTRRVHVRLKPPSHFRLIGTPHRRIDAVDIVTGRKQFAMDLDVPGALPTMLCRLPTINAAARVVRNLRQVAAMPGIPTS
jgi:isoquinoline 1-oxidoreductase beta subunit